MERYATPENLPEGEKLTDVCCCGVSSQGVLDNGIKKYYRRIESRKQTDFRI